MTDYLHIPVIDLIEENVAIGMYIKNYFGDVKLGQMTFTQLIDRYFQSGYADHNENREATLDAFAQFCSDIIVLQKLDVSSIKSLLIVDQEDKYHNMSATQVELKIGTATAIVGPTSSGKSALLDDIEGLVSDSSVTHRRILIDGQPFDKNLHGNDGQIYTQRISLSVTRSIENAETVSGYLHNHIPAVGLPETNLLNDIVEMANQLVGVRITENMPIDTITDRQFKALLVAEVALTSSAPILLLDELESFGIDKAKALKLLMRKDRICIVATHDPLLILMCKQRIVMDNGAVSQLITTSEKEKAVLQELYKTEKQQDAYRKTFRNGEVILM